MCHGFQIILSYQNLPLLTFGRKVESLWNLVGNNSNVFQGLLAKGNFGDSKVDQSSKFFSQDESPLVKFLNHQRFSSKLFKVSPKQLKMCHGIKIVLSYQNLPLLTFGRKVESLWNLVGNNSNVFQGLLAQRNFGDLILDQSSKFYGQDQS